MNLLPWTTRMWLGIQQKKPTSTWLERRGEVKSIFSHSLNTKHFFNIVFNTSTKLSDEHFELTEGITKQWMRKYFNQVGHPCRVFLYPRQNNALEKMNEMVSLFVINGNINNYQVPVPKFHRLLLNILSVHGIHVAISCQVMHQAHMLSTTQKSSRAQNYLFFQGAIWLLNFPKWSPKS